MILKSEQEIHCNTSCRRCQYEQHRSQYMDYEGIHCNTFSRKYFIWKDGVFSPMESKAHVCSIRFTTEEYGWLARYSEKNDMSVSQVVRKAVKTYRAALASKQKKEKKEEG